MKRSGPIQRTTRLRSTGRLKPVGATKLKKQKRYKAFLSSAVWKRLRREALEDAGHRCQNTEGMGYWWDGPSMRGGVFQCDATEKLTVHHLTYARFGGDELPSDLQVLCRSCHDRLHGAQGKRGAA